jgi:hypothetical protein
VRESGNVICITPAGSGRGLSVTIFIGGRMGAKQLQLRKQQDLKEQQEQRRQEELRLTPTEVKTDKNDKNDDRQRTGKAELLARQDEDRKQKERSFSFGQQFTLPLAFSYQKPSIASVTPQRINAKVAGQELTVYGDNFGNDPSSVEVKLTDIYSHAEYACDFIKIFNLASSSRRRSSSGGGSINDIIRTSGSGSGISNRHMSLTCAPPLILYRGEIQVTVVADGQVSNNFEILSVYVDIDQSVVSRMWYIAAISITFQVLVIICIIVLRNVKSIRAASLQLRPQQGPPASDCGSI